MGYSEFDEYESGPYGAVVPVGGLPSEYGDQPEAESGGLPADVLASLDIPGRPDPEQPSADPAKRPDHDLIEGFTLDLPRGGWVRFGSVFEISGGLRREIVTKIGILTQRMEQNKATAPEQVAVDNEVTTKLLRAVVEGWSYDDVPLPVGRDALDRLPGLVVDRISVVAAEYMKMLLSKPGGNAGSETDPASPQRPSAG